MKTKPLLRRLVLSATFRQASTPTPEGREKDPAHRYLARGPILRLTGVAGSVINGVIAQVESDWRSATVFC
jgi:hypothetical protein